MDHPEGPATSPGPERSPEVASIRRLWQLGAEWLDHAAYYAEARVDQWREGSQRLLDRWAWEVGIRVGAALALVAGAVFIFVGLALGVGQWTGQPWAGWMLSGALLCSLTAGVLAYYLRRRARQELEQARQKYARRRARQQARHGRSTADRGRATISSVPP